MNIAIPARLFLAAAIVIAVTTLSPTSASASTSSTTYETAVQDRTNVKRVANGRVRVAPHSCLDRWAEGQARWMADRHLMQHRSGRMEKILADCNMSSASENIAFGFLTGNLVVTAWMNSLSHRTNLLRRSSRYIGVGAVQDSRGVWYVAQVFGAR
ncbi:MAG: hypothetical protein JWP31_580 [Aeromicrobium sp.]|nr:hypothetical protein [Aeromicrobium sp.]